MGFVVEGTVTKSGVVTNAAGDVVFIDDKKSRRLVTVEVNGYMEGFTAVVQDESLLPLLPSVGSMVRLHARRNGWKTKTGEWDYNYVFSHCDVLVPAVNSGVKVNGHG